MKFVLNEVALDCVFLRFFSVAPVNRRSVIAPYSCIATSCGVRLRSSGGTSLTWGVISDPALGWLRSELVRTTRNACVYSVGEMHQFNIKSGTTCNQF